MPPKIDGVSILRPCEGAEPGLERALSALNSAHIGRVEMVACMPSLADPAADVARSVGAKVAVDRGETIDWTNPKVRHLEAGVHSTRSPIVMFADADAVIDESLLDALMGTLSEDGVSGAFAPPMAAPGRGWGNRVLRTALGGSFYAWPALVSLTRALGKPSPMSGALVAFRRGDLNDGLERAAHSIGDDLALAEALQKRGNLRMIETPVVCLHGDIPLSDAIRVLRRWVWVAASHSPSRLLGFPFVFSASPFLLLMLAFGPSGASAMGLGFALLVRILVAALIRYRYLGEGVRVAELLFVEALLLDAAVRAAWALVTRKELAWRDRRYTLGRDGRIEAVRTVVP